MKKVAILIESLFDEKELIYPYYRLLEEGYEVDLVGTDKGITYSSKSNFTMDSTHASRDVRASDYDAVVIPGGFSPDYMRRSEDSKKFVSDMNKSNKPIAAICHGVWMMISSCDLSGRKMTCYHAIKDDLVNAGADYLDKELVVDGNYITSRTPADLPVFIKAIIRMIEK